LKISSSTSSIPQRLANEPANQKEKIMKKMTSLMFAAGLVVVLALLLTPQNAPAAHAAPKAPASTAATMPAPVPAAAPEEHHPIHEALESLRSARAHIHDAHHNFGGHRDEALRRVDEAIRQLEICERYDR